MTFYCVGFTVQNRYCHASISKVDYKLVKKNNLSLQSLSSYRCCNNLKIQKSHTLSIRSLHRWTEGTSLCLVTDRQLIEVFCSLNGHSIGLWEANWWLEVTKGSKLPSLWVYLDAPKTNTVRWLCPQRHRCKAGARLCQHSKTCNLFDFNDFIHHVNCIKPDVEGMV